MSITIDGIDEALAALDALLLHVERGSENAVAEATQGTFDDSQDLVPYDSVTKHSDDYVHLQDSAKQETNGLEGSVSYGTDHCEFVEFGTSKMAAQPYLNPAFEVNAPKLVKACEDLVK